MSEWPVVRLGDVAELLTGFPFASSRYTDKPGDPRLLRGDNVVQGALRWDGVKRWPADAMDKVRDYALQEGDVVVAMDRPWIEAGLKYAILRRDDLPALLVQRVARLRGKSGLHTPFLGYVIGSRNFTEYVLSVQTGTTVPHISGPQLREFTFALPPLRQQRAIASILGALDDKIELNRRMSETLETMARALFKSWFADFDPARGRADAATIPASYPSSLEASEIGNVPTGWRVADVGEVAERIYSGGTPSTASADYWSGDLAWLSSGETRAPFIDVTERTISGEGAERSSTRLAPRGSTVIASAGQGNTRGQTSMLLIDSYISQSVVVLVPNRSYTSPAHLFFDLERRYEEFRRISDGHSSRGSLTTKLLAGLKMVVPDRRVLQQFDALVDPMIGRIQVARGEAWTLAELRDALLPKLLSGELRIPDAERLTVQTGA